MSTSALEMANTASSLDVLQRSEGNIFVKPAKKIHEEGDVSTFHASKAYKDITSFIMQLNRSMVPTVKSGDQSKQRTIQVWELESSTVTFPSTVQSLRDLLSRLDAMIEEAPPDTGPRRFGNVSFRKWYSIMETRIPELLRAYLPSKLLGASGDSSDGTNAIVELKGYLLGSFGSPQRLDYGTGHELSFVAFIACIWKLGGFERTAVGSEERGIVLGIIEPYVYSNHCWDLLCCSLIVCVSLQVSATYSPVDLDLHS